MLQCQNCIIVVIKLDKYNFKSRRLLIFKKVHLRNILPLCKSTNLIQLLDEFLLSWFFQIQIDTLHLHASQNPPKKTSRRTNSVKTSIFQLNKELVTTFGANSQLKSHSGKMRENYLPIRRTFIRAKASNIFLTLCGGVGRREENVCRP